MLNKKIIKRGLFSTVILLLLGTIVYDQIRLQREPVQYHMDIQTEDFAINNINLLATPDHVYIAGGYFLEFTGGDSLVDGVIIDGRVSGVRLFDMGVSEPFFKSDIYAISGGNVIGGIQLNPKSVLHMKIKYTIHGKSKEYTENIVLKDKVKPFSFTTTAGDKSYKIYEVIPRVATKPAL